MFGNAPDGGRVMLAPAGEPASDAAPAAEPSPFLRRTAVFDAQRRIAGHLFHLQQSAPIPGDDLPRQRALDAILLDTLNAAPTAWNSGLAFIPISSASIELASLDQLRPANIVLMLHLAEGTETTRLCARLNELRSRGLRIGLFRQPKHPAFSEAIRLADCAAIDVAASEAMTIRDFSAAVRATTPASLFACHVETADDFRFCEQWRYSYFAGRFAEQPERPVEHGADPHKMHLLHLLRLVQGDADTPEIIDALKHDPLLSFRILRYLNSPALGLSRHIDSLSQALIILGRQQLSRWLTIMLFSVQDPEPMDWLMIERALMRGRLMELFAAGTALARETDALFLTGIFSCLDRLLRRPLPEILGDMSLAASIRSALLDDAGPYAPLLHLARASESFEETQMHQVAENAGVPAAAINPALLAATAWATEVTEYWD